jgi:hypothetical protein
MAKMVADGKPTVEVPEEFKNKFVMKCPLNRLVLIVSFSPGVARRIKFLKRRKRKEKRGVSRGLRSLRKRSNQRRGENGELLSYVHDKSLKSCFTTVHRDQALNLHQHHHPALTVTAQTPAVAVQSQIRAVRRNVTVDVVALEGHPCDAPPIFHYSLCDNNDMYDSKTINKSRFSFSRP